MDPKVHDLFKCPVYETQINLNIKLINDYCQRLNRSVKGVTKSNRGGWQSPPIDSIEIPILSKEIGKHAALFKKELSLKNSLKICNMWVNINNYKDFNIQHTHPTCLLSGVYYVKSPLDSGSLNFFHPADSLMQSDWFKFEREDYNKYNSPNWHFEPKENMLILFPAWLEHSVSPNLNKKERVCISFNLK